MGFSLLWKPANMSTFLPIISWCIGSKRSTFPKIIVHMRMIIERILIASQAKMGKNACMPVVEVSEGEFKLIYWREVFANNILVPK